MLSARLACGRRDIFSTSCGGRCDKAGEQFAPCKDVQWPLQGSSWGSRFLRVEEHEKTPTHVTWTCLIFLCGDDLKATKRAKATTGGNRRRSTQRQRRTGRLTGRQQRAAEGR